MRAKEKEPVVTLLTSPTVAEGLVKGTALLTAACYSRGPDRGQRASHSRAGIKGCSAELPTDDCLLDSGQVDGWS